jgi:hypothetical protein
MDNKTRLKIEIDCLSRLENDFKKAKERYEIQRDRVDRLAEKANLFVLEAPTEITNYNTPTIIDYRSCADNHKSTNNKN